MSASQKYICSNIKLDLTLSALYLENESGELSQVDLQPLELKVLIYLIDNPNKIIAKNDLCHLWDSGAPSDQAIAQLISKLRAKLRILDKNAEPIKTVSKVGYKFILEKEKPIASSTSVKQTSPPKKHKIVKNTAITFIVLLLVTFAFKSLIAIPNKSEDNYSSVIELIDNSSMKYEVSFSPNGQFALYSAQKLGDDFFSLGLMSIKDSNTKFTSRKDTHLHAPIWLNASEVAYRVKNNQECHVEKNSIQGLVAKQPGEVLFSCSKLTSGFSLSLLNAQTILMSDAPRGSMPSHLYSVNIETGKSKELLAIKDADIGPYRSFVSPNQKYVGLLSSVKRPNTLLQIYESSDFNSPIVEKLIPYPLTSIALNNNSVIYKNQFGGIDKLGFDNYGTNDTISYPMTLPIYSVTQTPKGIAFLGGELFSQHLEIKSLITNKSIPIVQEDGVRNRLPYFINKNSIVYSSNETGISQLWIADISNNSRRQISHFVENTLFNSISSNQATNQFAIETQAEIKVYNINNEGFIKEVYHQFEGKNPTYIDDNLIYTKQVNGTYQLFSWNSKLYKHEQITFSGGYDSKKSGSKLYYTKYDKPGVWELNASSENAIVYSTNEVFDEWGVLGQSIFYEVDQTAYRYDLIKKEKVQLEGTLCQKMTNIIDMQCIDTRLTKNANKLFMLNQL